MRYLGRTGEGNELYKQQMTYVALPFALAAAIVIASLFVANKYDLNKRLDNFLGGYFSNQQTIEQRLEQR